MSRTDVGLPSSGVQGERQQRPAGVVASGRHPHGRHRTGCCAGRAGTIVARAGVPSGGLRRSWATNLSCRTTAAPASTTSCPPSLGPAAPTARCRRGCRRSSPRPARWCCSCSTAWAGSSSQDRAALAPTLRSHGRRADPHRGAVDHGHRADLDHHRADAGRARRGRLPHRRPRRGAQRAALGDDRRRRPPAHPAGAVPAASRRSWASTSPWSPGPSSPARASRSAHLAGVAPDRLPAAVVACVVEVRRLLAGGEPFVYAYYEGIDKVAHEYGLERALRRRAGRRRPAGRPTCSRCCRPTPRCWSPPTTARSTCGDRLVTPDAGVLDLVALQSGEGRFRWLHARPGRGRRPARAAADGPRRRGLGGAREQVVRRGLVRARSHARRRRAGSATWPWWPGRRMAFDDPADTGPFRLVCRHGSLTAAEMHVPLLAGDRRRSRCRTRHR